MSEMILSEHRAKLDALLAETKESLSTVEGPHCRFHNRWFNTFWHPYYAETSLYTGIINWGAIWKS